MSARDDADRHLIRERARDLRGEGLSTPAIAERVGVSRSTVRDWVADLPKPEWTRRPNAKDAQRERARELRLAGRTYPEIAGELGVSKGSVSLWVRDLPTPPRKRRSDHGRVARSRRMADVRRQQTKFAAGREVGAELSDRELLLVGAALYWAEGAKDKQYALKRREQIRFINSDPDVITVFLRWLKLFGIAPTDCTYTVAIHETADLAVAERFWADHVGVEADAFCKAAIKVHNPKTNRQNTGSSYVGCLSVYVRRSADLYRRMEGWWYGIVVAAGANPGQLCQLRG